MTAPTRRFANQPIFRDGGQLTQMTVGSDVLRFGYDANGSPMYLQFNNSRYFYATNLQGDVIALVHTSGTAVVEYTYDAWGNILTVTGSMASTLGQINPLRYRGYVYDVETHLYYLQSRYYDPAIGRFLNADAFASTGQGILGNNMYAYCNNNPVGNIDHSGTFGICVLEDPMNMNRSFMTPGMFGGGCCGGGNNVADVSSSYYARQNVIAYDRYWRNSCYNPNMTWSCGTTVQATATIVPQHAQDTLDYIKEHNGAPPKGYKGGKSFKNDGRNGGERLPDSYMPFYEYDVHPKVQGEQRGEERIVIGNGAAWYTNNHYFTFIRME